MENLKWPDPSLRPLSLTEDVRPMLIRQEESIIFALIERSQFMLNPSCYVSGKSSILTKRLDANPKNPHLSLMDYFLLETERFQARLGRYNCADEHAFNVGDLGVDMSMRSKPSKIMANSININDQIKHVYLNEILPKMCSQGDGVDLGSTCTCDVSVLQALSKRIHYGKFVAEAKFIANKEKFTKLILANDAEGLMELLTFVKVEEAVVKRVEDKASHYGTDGTSSNSAYKVDPKVIAELYRDYLIPLNKQVQVEYLLQRVDRPAFAHCADTANSLTAGKKHFGKQATPLACTSVTEVFRAVATNQVPFGVVPIQTPGLGLVKETQRCFLSSSLKVSAAVELASADQPDSIERYFIIGPILPTLTNAITHFVLLFATSHEPGALVKALNSMGRLNICSVESLPSTNDSDNIYFYCEVESPPNEKVTREALEALEKVTSDVIRVGYIYKK